MSDHVHDLSLSCTFKVVNGRLSADDSFEKTVTAPAAAALPFGGLAGAVIDSKYKVLALLGEGGMGAVYRVIHLQLNKEVALKTFRTVQLSPEAWERFQREARAIAKLSHKNIIQVFDFGIGAQNFPYYTMELLVGESLAERLVRSGALPLDQALPIFSAVAEGLAHAHRQGIVHRDIKPANIFMERGKAGSTPKIVDFGLAKLATSESSDSQSPEGQSPDRQRLTGVGVVFGSPLYMSPEQGSGVDTDQRTDIYSYGCSLFQALTGKPPFIGDSALATILMHQSVTPPSLVQAVGETFPARLEAIVARLLAKDVQRRYQSFEDVVADMSLINAAQPAGNLPASTMAAGEKSDRKIGSGTPDEVDQSDDQALPAEATGALKIFSLRGALALVLAGLAGLVAFAYNWHQQHPAVPVQESRPRAAPHYFSSKSADGHTITFSFPAGGDSIGDLEWKGGKSPNAGGAVPVPSGSHVRLKAGHLLSVHPELFENFQPDDLSSLTLPQGELWKSEHFAEIGYLKGLNELNIQGTPLKASDLKFIDQLAMLAKLNVSETDVTGKDLARLSHIIGLETLTVNALDDLTPLFVKLQQSKTIRHISVKGCKLKDGDIKEIVLIPKLQVLDADNNDFTAEGLKQLAPARHLVELRISGNGLGPEAIDVLQGFRRLEKLRIDSQSWPKDQQDRLTRALPPHCQQESSSKKGR